MQENLDSREIRHRLTAMHAQNRHLRLRDAALLLGTPEAGVIASFCGASVVRLRPAWKEILEALPALGSVMALTRNEHAVIEKKGPFEKVEIQGHAGLVLGEAIDLRLFLGSWASGFGVHEDSDVGLQRSVQFFDETGTAVHKVFLTEDSSASALDDLMSRFAAADQAPRQSFAAEKKREPERADGDVDLDGLRRGWGEMRDTHDFIFLLRRFAVTRTQALRLAGREWAEKVEVSSLRSVLETAAATDLPIMVFVGNRGAIEIHTGPVANVRSVGPWLNVLDPDFNLHMHEPGLASAWVVRKPTIDGTVTALEIYDAEGEVVALLFGKRKPGQPELEEWRQIVAALPRTV